MRHIFITGASSGIGYDLTNYLLNTEDCFVYAASRNLSSLENLQIQFPNKIKLVNLDVSKDDQIQSAYNIAKSNTDEDSEFILINNAGVAIGGPIEVVPLNEWRNLFDVNFFGLIKVTQTFLPLLRKHKGLIINVGSVSGRISSPFLAPYTSSKFAVRAFTDALRVELLPQSIRVVLIEPGPIRTAIWERSLEQSQKVKKYLNQETSKLYQNKIEALENTINFIEKNALPSIFVSKLILKIINHNNPRPYYLIGRFIRLQVLLTQLLPTKLVDRILAQGFRFKKNK